MLKKIPKKFLITIIIIILVIVSLFIWSWFEGPDYVPETFKENWNIDIPKPKYDNIQDVYYLGGIDWEGISIYKYNNEQIKELLNNNDFKKMNINEIEKVYKRYYNICSEKMHEIIDGYLEDQTIINDNNYYLCLTRESSPAFLILIVDISNNLLYSIQSI